MLNLHSGEKFKSQYKNLLRNRDLISLEKILRRCLWYLVQKVGNIHQPVYDKEPYLHINLGRLKYANDNTKHTQ